MSVVDNLNKIKSCKEDIKQAIMDKGVDMTNVAFTEYATKISEIQAGEGITDYLDYRAELSTYYSTVEQIPNYAFAYCSSLQSVNLPNCISVGDSAFVRCSSLQSIDLPNCMNIGDYAFQSCSSLQSIDLPNCMNIGDYAFQNCLSLSVLDLPMCSNVGTQGFGYCESLQSVNLPMCSIVGNYAFASCSPLQSVNLPNCMSVGTNTFQKCLSLSVLDLRSTYSCKLSNSNAFSRTPFASGIGSIYVHAAHLSQFQNATNWTYFSKCFVGVGDPDRPLLAFDNGRVYGDIYIFHNNWRSYLGVSNDSVISADLPNCSYVGSNAFYNCSSLQSANLPNCSYVGSNAFYDCSSLQSANLPNCSYVGKDAFRYCSSLQSVNLPNCEYIGTNALYIYNNTIDTVYIGTSISKVCQLVGHIFAADVIGGYRINKIFVPMSLVDAYKSAQYWSYYASHIFGI